MAIISHKWKFVFCLNARTASSSTASIMGETLAGEWFPAENILNAEGRIICKRKHSTFRELLKHKVLDQATFDNYLKVTTVRNPYDSLYSIFTKKKYAYQELLKDQKSFIYHNNKGYAEDIVWIKDKSFEEWVIKHYEELAEEGTQISISKKFTIHADLILKFENIQEDFRNKFLPRIKCTQDIIIPHRKKTEGREADYREGYTKRAKEIMETILKDECELNGYSF